MRLWEHPVLCQRLMQDLRMPNMLLQALRSWGGTQESVTSLAGGEVTFQPRVAMRVSTLIVRKHGASGVSSGVAT